ncbi:MAG: lysophospholipid acyltransferase family protein [bacterium]
MKINQRFIRWLIYIKVRFVYFIVLLLPFKLNVWLGGRLGLLAYYCLGRPRRLMLENLRQAFPDKSTRQIKKIAREVLVNQGKNIFEVLYFPKLDRRHLENIITTEGLEHLTAGLRQGKGVLLLTAHLGNWELLGIYLSLAGYPINVIARRLYDERLNNMLVHLRESKGVKCILRNESSYQVLRCLRRNEALGVLIDQDTNVQGVFVDFFGRPTYTPQGLAAIALRSGAAVVPTFIVRIGGRHKVILKEQVELKLSADEKQDIVDNTQKFTRIIESMIRSYPSQWVWMHQRWKTTPQDKQDKTEN